MLRLLRGKPSLHLPYSTATTAPNPHIQSRPLLIDHSLTLYFLQKSCKLSPAAATAAAHEINLKSTKNAHAILSLLRDYKFSESQIVRLISTRPKLLLASPTRIIKPKLDFYASIGLSADDFTGHFCAHDRLFLSSTSNRLVPNLRLLRTLLPSEADVLAAIRRYPSIILSDLKRFVPAKTNALLDAGLPVDNIINLIALRPRCLTKSPIEFESAISAIKDMGFKPSTSAFAHACKVIFKVPKAVWESKIQNFERLGWSRDHVMCAFTRHPDLMSASEEKVTRIVKFFAEKLGWGPEKLSKSPVIISLSLDKRISPRYRVCMLLEERGLLKHGITPLHFSLAEKKFMKSYVNKYQELVPEILEALSGNLGEEKDIEAVFEQARGDGS